MTLHDDLKLAFERVRDAPYRPDPRPVFTPTAKALLDRLAAGADPAAGYAGEGGYADTAGRKIGQLINVQVGKLRQQLDEMLVGLPAGYRLCVHDMEFDVEPPDPGRSVMKFAVRQTVHALAPGDHCSMPRRRAEYGPRPEHSPDAPA